jgi:3-hydroxyacyl-[acyl-carrier-protein] dehydratase
MPTKFHRHRFAAVQDYLHHRPPYLLVERIAELGEDFIVAEMTMTGDEFFAQGHFPGLPILPGAMMQELTTQSAGILIAANYNPLAEFDTSDPHANQIALGVLVRVKQANYRGFVRPGDQLRVHATLEEQVADIFQFAATITVANQVVMKNRFQLANIPTQQLRGQQLDRQSSELAG